MANCCVICYRVELTNSSPDLAVRLTEDHYEGQAIFRRYFQLLERYLNEGEGIKRINQWNFPLKEVLSIGMISCQECRHVMSSFCQLYDQLKKTELLLNWKLWTMRNLMESAQKVTPRVNGFRESIRKLEMEGNGLESSGDELFELVMKSRKSMIDQCSRRLISGYPRLPITRVKDSTTTTPIRQNRDGQKRDNDPVQDDLACLNLNSTPQPISNPIPSNCTDDVLIKAELVPSEGSGSKLECVTDDFNNFLSSFSESDTNSDHAPVSPVGISDYIEDGDQNTATVSCEPSPYPISSFSSDEIAKSRKLELTKSVKVDQNKVASEDLPGHSKSNTEGPRSLRSVYKCSGCTRTFSSRERLTGHQVKCCADLDNDTDAEDAEGVENEDVRNDYKFNDTDIDTTDTSDDDNEEGSEGEMNWEAPHINDAEDSHKSIHVNEDETISKSQNAARSATDEERPWNCSTCKNLYKSKKNLDDHILMKHPEQWKAAKTNTPFVPPAIQNHATDLKGSTPFNNLRVAYRFKCEDCHSLFIKIEALLIHRHKTSCRPSIINTDDRRTTRVDLLHFSGKHAVEKVKRLKDSLKFATLEVPDRGVFFCHKNRCNAAFYSEEDLKCHQQLHGKFKCSFCKVFLAYAPDLAEHELKHSKSVKREPKVPHAEQSRRVRNIKCLRCDRIFRNKMGYICHHLAEHMSLTLINNLCVICNSFNEERRPAAIRHYKLHHDISDVKPELVKRCSVENCCAYFLTLPQLLTHHKRRHGSHPNQIKDIISRERRMYKCQDCDQSLTTRQSLSRHRVMYHVEEDSVLHCSVAKCRFACETEADLKNHMYYRHSYKNMEFIDCPKCSKSFNGVATLKMHMKSHDKNVGSERVKRQGRRGGGVVTGASNYRFKCPDCSYLFSTLDSLLAHRKKSHRINKDMEETANSGAGACTPNQNKITVEIFSFPHKVISKSLDRAKGFQLFAKIKVTDSVHVCPVTTCQRPFRFSVDLATHSKLHGEFTCKFCDVVKEYAPDLSEHELTHLDKACQAEPDKETNSHWNCPRCKLNCRGKERYLNHHLTSHLNFSLVDNRKCAICGPSGRRITRNSELIQHYKNAHGISNSSPSSVNNCKFVDCEAYFVTRRALTTHIKLNHGSEPQIMKERFDCKDCGKTFKSVSSLRAHRRHIHPATANMFPCPVPKCTISCETLAELESHNRQRHCSGMYFIDCPKCKKSINGTGAFKTHMRAHERKEKGLASVSQSFVCDACGKTCSSRSNLELHSMSHSGPESWAFACDVCSKKCLTQQKLDEHMRTHTKEKNFVCQICGQKYAHRHNLRIHVNSKHGDVTEDRPTKIHKRKPATITGGNVKRKRKLYTDKDDSSESSTSWKW